MNFVYKWVSGNSPTNKDWYDKILPDLKKIMENKKPEDIIFHTIFLGDMDEGPMVVAYGKDSDPCLYLEYFDKVEWSLV